MELKWLEDFLSLSQTGNFSRSASERNVTQSAFSRRIKALESWLGVVVVDRSKYPTTLTAAGREFRETAEEALRLLHGTRESLRSRAKPNPQTIAVATLHTLALSFFPRWLRQVETHLGPLNSRLLPEDFHACIHAIVEGGYDFLLTFYHPSVPLFLDPERFPHKVLGLDRLALVRAPDALVSRDRLPLLGYAQNSFLGKVSAFAGGQGADADSCVSHINESAMADAIKFMVLEGHGLAWLPRSLVHREIAEGRLVVLTEEVELEVRLYRNADHRRTVVSAVWEAAEEISNQSMRHPNIPD